MAPQTHARETAESSVPNDRLAKAIRRRPWGEWAAESVRIKQALASGSKSKKLVERLAIIESVIGHVDPSSINRKG